MSKAYDREWSFLNAIMLKLGFSSVWVNLIMRCVSSVSYSFRINQSIFGDIKPGRGLRQGDLLSPYLFTLCAQGLFSIISNAAASGRFKGVKLQSVTQWCLIFSLLMTV